MRLFEGTEFDIPPRCERCDQLEKDCDCRSHDDNVIEKIPREKQRLKIFTERRKRGKTITCIKGVDKSNLAELLTECKNRFGCGGTVKDGVVELQGEHAESAKELTRTLGFKLR